MTAGFAPHGPARMRSLVLSVLREPALARVEIAFVGFALAEAAAWVTMLVWAWGEGGTGFAGLVGILQLLPAIILAPFAALLLDRFPRGRVLMGGYLLQSAAFGLIALALSLNAAAVIVIVCAMLATASLVVTRPAQAAIFPELARNPAQLFAANGLAVAIENTGLAVGPAIAGLALFVAGPGALFALLAALLAAGGALVTAVRGVDQVRAGGASALEVARDLRDGLAAVARPGTRQVAALFGAPWLILGAVDVLATGLAVDLLGLDEAAAGYLLATLGVGGALGAIGSLRVAERRRLTPIALSALLVIAGMLGVLGAAPSPVPVLVALAILGGAAATIGIASRTLLQRSTDPMHLGRVFGVVEAFQLGSVALGALVAPLLAAAFGLTGAWLLLAIGCVATAGLIASGLGRVDLDFHVPAEQLAIVRGLAMFADQPALIQERIALLMRTEQVAAGETIVREGDPGDAWFALAAGSVAVFQGGLEIRRLEAGAGFGEIALLRAVPRTATVTAVTAVRLEVLSREDFLACVSAYPTTGHHADVESRQRLAADAGRGGSGDRDRVR